MYQDTLNKLANNAAAKQGLLKHNPTGFFIGAMMGGAYVGLGVLLILILGNSVPVEWQKLVMGLSFSIALTLVVFAGAELFTGYTMYAPIAVKQKKISLKQLGSLWLASWAGNFFGAVLLVFLFVISGAGGLLEQSDNVLTQIATYKMNASWYALIAKGILCNWLVCLALWMCARIQSESAKCIVIFLCLFNFISSGYEHSIANMTLLTLSLFSQGNEVISIAGLAHNLVWVTLGNIIAGCLFVAMGYMKMTVTPEPPKHSQTSLQHTESSNQNT